MSPASSDLEIDGVTAARRGARPRPRRRLVLRWRVEALLYAVVVVGFGAVPLALLRITIDPLGLIDRAPFVVLEAVSLAVGVVAAELLMAMRRHEGGGGDGGPGPRPPFSHDSGGAQALTARDSTHEHGSNVETLDTDRRSPREPVARSRSHE